MILFDGYSQFRHYTGCTDTTIVSDDDIKFYIESSESLIFNRAGIKFYDTAITELRDGDDTDTIVLNKFPLRSVTKLTVDDDVIPSSCYLVYTDTNTIFLKYGKFPENEIDKQNIEIQYTYGCPQAENQDKFNLAKRICFYTVAKDILSQAGNKTSEGILSEKLGNYSITYGSKGPYGMQIDRIDEILKESYKALGYDVSLEVM